MLLLSEPLNHVVFNVLLLGVKNLQTVLDGHLASQAVGRAEEALLVFLELQLEAGDVDALQTLLKRLERLGEGQQHEDALQSFEQVLRLLVLSR